MNYSNRLKHHQRLAILSEHCIEVRFQFQNGPETLGRKDAGANFTNLTDMSRSELFSWLGYKPFCKR